MKFLIFNIAIVGALYYLFTVDVNRTHDIANSARQAVDRVEKMASSAVLKARNLTSKQASVKETTPPVSASGPPVIAPSPEAERVITSPVKTVETVPSAPPSPPETSVDITASDASTEDLIPARSPEARSPEERSPEERRKELLDMAQNMEFFYLRKAGE